MADDRAAVEENVYAALREILGYLPEPTDDLDTDIDSMQKLELLVVLEEKLGIPFGDDAVGGDWWGSREAIVAHVRDEIGQLNAS